MKYNLNLLHKDITKRKTFKMKKIGALHKILKKNTFWSKYSPLSHLWFP
jgi:hypothetical protein